MAAAGLPSTIVLGLASGSSRRAVRRAPASLAPAAGSGALRGVGFGGGDSRSTARRLPRPCASSTGPELGPDGKPTMTPRDWDFKYLYDGGCTVCLSLVAMLRGRKGSERIYFENIDAPAYSPEANKGITKQEALATIHVITPGIINGKISKGLDALKLLYGAVGLGWVFKLAALPFLSPFAEIIYKLVSKNRTALGGGMDALMALGKIKATESGETNCAEGGECRDGFSSSMKTESDEAPAAAATAGGDSAAAAATVATAASDAPAIVPASVAPPPPPPAEGAPPEPNPGSWAAGTVTPPVRPPPESVAVLKGSALDRTNILGVYYSHQLLGAAGAMVAAPVNCDTGQLLREEVVVPLAATDLESMADCLKQIIAQLDWKGVVGVGLPGLVRHHHETVNPSLPAEAMSALELRHARFEMERELQEETEREVLVMTGAEANGYGELLHGAGRGEMGLVLMIMLGRGIGACLYDHGVLVRNVAVAEHFADWNAPPWSDATLPKATVPAGDPAWARWAARVGAFAARLESVFGPNLIVVGGSAVTTMPKWAHLCPEVKQPLVAAANHQGETYYRASIMGAAVGGRVQLTFRDDLARVRAAVGRTRGVSPQRLGREDLLKVFNGFDQSGDGFVTKEELAAAVQALGVGLAEPELRQLLSEIDSDNLGAISFAEFTAWWDDIVAASPVTYLHTEAEFDGVIAEESTSGRLVVIEVGFTYCRPCRAFEPTYKEFARAYSGARFFRMNGNENQDTVRIGRDRLKVKATPSFFFFRNGVEVHRHSGASRTSFEDFLKTFEGAATGEGGDGNGGNGAKINGNGAHPEAAAAAAGAVS